MTPISQWGGRGQTTRDSGRGKQRKSKTDTIRWPRAITLLLRLCHIWGLYKKKSATKLIFSSKEEDCLHLSDSPSIISQLIISWSSMKFILVCKSKVWISRLDPLYFTDPESEPWHHVKWDNIISSLYLSQLIMNKKLRVNIVSRLLAYMLYINRQFSKIWFYLVYRILGGKKLFQFQFYFN